MFDDNIPTVSEAMELGVEGIFIHDVVELTETLDYYFPQETEDYTHPC
jgi:hypothetical protein